MNAEYHRKIGIEYFSWQYMRPCEPTVLTCAFDGEDLVGTFGLKMRALNDGNIAGQATDMLVAPKYREQGIFKELVRVTLENIGTAPHLLCVFPNANGRRAVEGSLGWKCIGTMATYFLPGNHGALPRGDNYPACRQSRRTCFEKTDRYRDWRFEEHPHYRYRYFRSEGGLVVTKLYRDPLSGKQYGDIVDARFKDTGDSGPYELFLRACEDLVDNDIEGITTWALPGSALMDMTTALGFEKTGQERHFCVKILHDRCRRLGLFENWDLVPADTEVY